MRTPILMLAIRSVLNRRGTALLTITSMALAVMLFAGVEKIRQGAQTSFERTISGTDLIVGARSGPINLVLYSVFHLGDATNNITWDSYQDIAARPDVAWTVPLSLGDSHSGYRVIGSTAEFFERYRYGEDDPIRFAQGQPFNDVFDAVIGAAAARDLGYTLGQKIILSHGVGAVSFVNHDDKPFTIVGVLAPTGTPVDRSILVSLEGIEAIHLGWQSGAPTPMARVMTAERVQTMDLQPTQITAFLLGLNSRVAVLRLQRDINTYAQEPLMAVIPGVALRQLWDVVGVAERALSVVSAFVILVGLAGILTSILTTLNERRREMAILRSVGARPRDVFILLASEAGLLAFIGSLIGLGLLYAALFVAQPIIQARFGVNIGGFSVTTFDLGLVLAVTLAALALGAIPAWRAFQRSLADGLTIRL